MIPREVIGDLRFASDIADKSEITRDTETERGVQIIAGCLGRFAIRPEDLVLTGSEDDSIWEREPGEIAGVIRGEKIAVEAQVCGTRIDEFDPRRYFARVVERTGERLDLQLVQPERVKRRQRGGHGVRRAGRVLNGVVDGPVARSAVVLREVNELDGNSVRGADPGRAPFIAQAVDQFVTELRRADKDQPLALRREVRVEHGEDGNAAVGGGERSLVAGEHHGLVIRNDAASGESEVEAVQPPVPEVEVLGRAIDDLDELRAGGGGRGHDLADDERA